MSGATPERSPIRVPPQIPRELKARLERLEAKSGEYSLIPACRHELLKVFNFDEGTYKRRKQPGGAYTIGWFTSNNDLVDKAVAYQRELLELADEDKARFGFPLQTTAGKRILEDYMKSNGIKPSGLFSAIINRICEKGEQKFAKLEREMEKLPPSAENHLA